MFRSITPLLRMIRLFFSILIDDMNSHFGKLASPCFLQCPKHTRPFPTENSQEIELQSDPRVFQESISENDASHGCSIQKDMVNVTFADKDGEEKNIKVPVGMSMLEAVHENDIELEGACEGSLACSTCHVIVMDMDYYNKLEDPNAEENNMA
ncbi:2Fe-2S ferredoxin-type domain-containing protein [Citrus sinensis]|nr:2Fe-2S ferredoxin-type domain-containing protein [Citrus sinensis]